MIIGQPGAGKSTLALRLGEKTGLPVYHMDQIHWKSGWIERPVEEKTPLVKAVHAKEAWIFEGGHSLSWPERLERCDTLLWIDISMPVRMWRVIKRRLIYSGRTRPDLPDYCNERLDPEFLKWIWDTRITNRLKLKELFENAPETKQKQSFKSLRQVNAFLGSI